MREVQETSDTSGCLCVGRVAVGVLEMTGQASSFKEASLNCGCGAFDPPMRVERRSERRWHCLRWINRRVRGLRTDPEHVAPITGYGAKAPVGFPCWMSMGNSCAAISGRNGRSGARDDAHSQRKLALELTPGADPRAPAPSTGEQS